VSKPKKLYREEINSKIKSSNTQPAKKLAKSGIQERSWCYWDQPIPAAQPISTPGALLGGLRAWV
jgi:hypothetical protein